MPTKNDGGPAFPVPSDANNDETGMTFRDWFAGQAIGAVIRQCVNDAAVLLGDRSPEEYFAEKAFAVADAMISEREK